MTIACLMGTYGRFSVAGEALACFLQQTAVSQATLLIHNQHPVPMSCDHPAVRVVNEPSVGQPLRHIRQRMLELADPSADLVHFWDDDDLYLPWHLEDCIAHIGAHAAWKPASSWMSLGNTIFSRHANTFEGSWVFRAEYLKAAALDTHPDYPDHPVYPQAVESGSLGTTEFNGRTSYIYRWANGTEHLSAYGGASDEAAQTRRVERWRSGSTDVRSDGRLVPADMIRRWRQYLDGTRDQVTPEEWELNRQGLGM